MTIEQIIKKLLTARLEHLEWLEECGLVRQTGEERKANWAHRYNEEKKLIKKHLCKNTNTKKLN